MFLLTLLLAVVGGGVLLISYRRLPSSSSTLLDDTYLYLNSYGTKVRTHLIDAIGNLIADVLAHPRVEASLAQVVVNGINQSLEQPDLVQRLETVLQNNVRPEDTMGMSRAFGEQLPGLAANFVGGAVSSIRWKKSVKTSDPTFMEEGTDLKKKNG